MKARLLKVVKWVLIVAMGLLVLAQFKRPAKTNPATDASQALEAHLQLDPKIASILDRSCNDCHSNKTRWPWYANVAPVSWFVINHVDHGRSHLN
ncbi:MAG TPA: heme-binding domain-containing protein, partial [Pyrinomonadaceae bacterium]|nr:heme-binding domain-containing protein [Pyrinomonadaceae bacterium]